MAHTSPFSPAYHRVQVLALRYGIWPVQSEYYPWAFICILLVLNSDTEFSDVYTSSTCDVNWGRFRHPDIEVESSGVFDVVEECDYEFCMAMCMIRAVSSAKSRCPGLLLLPH